MKISNIKELEFKDSIYIKPKRYSFTNDGKNCVWDFIEAMDSVSILLYHKSLQSFVFVKQFRIALWFHQQKDANYIKDDNMGYTIELCSGLVDKQLSLEQIAKEECIEELGYSPKKLEKIGEFYTGFGSGASKQTLYFAEIDEEDKISNGGGICEEVIESVFVKIEDFQEFVTKITRSPLLDYACLWFINKANSNI
ncbi:NUDIX hydrolase [Campylobacter sp. US33a]|uniref:NUDIX hydrolase n=1 Tax=Campylobacter sp. CCS1377 TaxID=3158229 RepID=A0AAU7EA83_9BACT|nr:NUDIX hydrolase [Campylobacter sp. US33a]TEY00238.1 NUDIX hydrolase [Campylobacter sp. US33a]